MNMSIKLFLPSRLTYLAKGREVFEVTGKTVGECLDALVSIVPPMKNTLFYESEKVLQSIIEVRLNQETIDSKGLSRSVEEGDEIHVAIKTD